MTKKHFNRAAEIVAGMQDRKLALIVASYYIQLFQAFNDRFDYDRCTGCATCYEQCPVHAIEMVPEMIPEP